ncbi:MAG: hypothetical protein R3Y63_09345 [Eubacteriales bacterium]
METDVNKEIIETQEPETTQPVEITYIQGTPHVKEKDGKIYGLFVVTRPEDIENLYQYLENFNADSGMTAHTIDTSIHTSSQEKEIWETGAATAASALSQTVSLSASVAEMQGRLDKVEDSVESNITANPYSIKADNLDGILLSKGIWNQEKGRIEC